MCLSRGTLLLTGLISLGERETVSKWLWFVQVKSLRLQSSSQSGGFQCPHVLVWSRRLKVINTFSLTLLTFIGYNPKWLVLLLTGKQIISNLCHLQRLGCCRHGLHKRTRAFQSASVTRLVSFWHFPQNTACAGYIYIMLTPRNEHCTPKYYYQSFSEKLAVQ